MGTALKYNLAIDSEGESTVTVVSDGQLTQVNAEHPNFKRIIDALLSGDDPTDLMFVKNELAAAIRPFGERVTLSPDGEKVFFDGVEVHSALTRQITRYWRDGRDITGLKLFWERLSKNPSENSKAQLFEWVSNRNLVIDEEGYFYAYKGVNRADAYGSNDDTVKYPFRSSSSGKAFVDGVLHNGYIPNGVGAVVSMPREWVADDPSTSCSTGLHVGTWDYSKDFGSVTLEVKIDPADVVSVPSDSYSQKMRVSHYEVVAIHEPQVDDLSQYEAPSTIDESNLEALEPVVPKSFLERLRSRWGRS